MISFKYGDDVAKTIHDYMNHLNGQDRGKNMNLPTLYNHLEHYSKVANTLRGVQDIEAGKRYTLHDEKMVKIFKQCLDDGELARWKRASLDEMPTTHREVTWPELKKNLHYVQSDEELARTLKVLMIPRALKVGVQRRSLPRRSLGSTPSLENIKAGIGDSKQPI
jgi:hypothetical protein